MANRKFPRSPRAPSASMQAASSPTRKPARRSATSSPLEPPDRRHEPLLQHGGPPQQGTPHRIPLPRTPHHHRRFHPGCSHPIQLRHQPHHRRVPRIPPHPPPAPPSFSLTPPSPP